MSIFHAVNGVDYHATIQGNPQGIPLLLLHGFTGTGRVWERQSGVLGASFKLIAPDLLGHGETSAPTDPSRYAIERAADDLITLAEYLDCVPFGLHGYSMGGRLALYMALHYPEAVRSLSLESASPGLADEPARRERVEADERLADRIESDGLAWFAAYWQSLPLFESQRRLPEHVLDAQRSRRLAANPVGLANSLRGMGTGVQPSLWPMLRILNMPVLLLTGEEDAKFSQVASQMHLAIPNADWHTVPDAGHAVYLESPQRWAAEVAEFHERVI